MDNRGFRIRRRPPGMFDPPVADGQDTAPFRPSEFVEWSEGVNRESS